MAITMMIMIGITVTMLAIMMMTKTKMEKAWGYAKFPECWRLGDRYEIDLQMARCRQIFEGSVR